MYIPAHNDIRQASTVSNKRGYFWVKRLMDIVGAVCGLIILSPLFGLIAMLIKIECSKGSVFFKQVRIGKDGRGFYMFKFRSMCVDAEDKLAELLKHNEIEGAMFKMKDDPRITRVGRFIRRYSLDELPQLWNVLRGDMSLVGPRPPLAREVVEYTEYDKQRLLATPGCTGLWQISGRSHLSFEQMVELDLEYIRNASVGNDVKILYKTVGAVFGSDDAF